MNRADETPEETYACDHCGREVCWSTAYNAWVDAGTQMLVYCEDEYGPRHDVAEEA